MGTDRILTIWVCEDDESLWDYQREVLKENFPKASTKFFLNAGYAVQATGNPDFIIMDVGGLTRPGGKGIILMNFDIKALSNLYPGTIFIINSALGAYAEEAYNELKPEYQAVSRWADGCNMGKDICNIIKEYEG